MIQIFPSASAAALETWPSVHPFGICGQEGSTENLGTATLETEPASAAEVWRETRIVNAAIMARVATAGHAICARNICRFVLISLILSHLIGPARIS